MSLTETDNRLYDLTQHNNTILIGVANGQQDATLVRF